MNWFDKNVIGNEINSKPKAIQNYFSISISLLELNHKILVENLLYNNVFLRMHGSNWIRMFYKFFIK